MSSEPSKLPPGATPLGLDEEVPPPRRRRDPNVRTHEEIVPPSNASRCVMGRLSELRAGREAGKELMPMDDGEGWASDIVKP